MNFYHSMLVKSSLLMYFVSRKKSLVASFIALHEPSIGSFLKIYVRLGTPRASWPWEAVRIGHPAEESEKGLGRRAASILRIVPMGFIKSLALLLERAGENPT
jgi:hypothetical protein